MPTAGRCVWQSGAVTSSSTPTGAQADPQPLPPIVTVDWLHRRLETDTGRVVVCEVGSTMGAGDPGADHRSGHVPAARFVSLDDVLADPPAATAGRHPLPSPEEFARRLGAIGIADDDTVVAYDRRGGGGLAARLVWMLRVIGEPAALLDGGLAAWDQPLEAGAVDVDAVERTTRPWPTTAVADADAVTEHLRAGGIVIDSRDRSRYVGDNEPIDPVAGHIPGAINLAYTDNLDETGRFRTSAGNSSNASPAWWATTARSSRAVPASPPATTCSRWSTSDSDCRACTSVRGRAGRPTENVPSPPVRTREGCREQRQVTATELAIVLVAVVIGAIAKAVTGMGLPLIAIPIASLFVDVETAIVVIAFPNVLANATSAAKERHSYPATRDLPTLAIVGVLGAVAGTLLLVNIPETPLVVAVIVAIVAYIVLFFAHPELRTTPERSKQLAPIVGGVAGVFQGAVGISGPIVGSWIHSYRLPRSAHILSVTSLFFITGLAQLVVLVSTGELAVGARHPARVHPGVRVDSRRHPPAELGVGTRVRPRDHRHARRVGPRPVPADIRLTPTRR